MCCSVRNYIFLLFCMFSCGSALNVKANFPSSTSTKFPRLRLLGTLPSLDQFTACAWIKPFHFRNDIVAILSYANSKSDNAIFLGLKLAKGLPTIRIHIGGHYKDFGCSRVNWKTGNWYHICVSRFGPEGNCKVYVNGGECTDTAGTKGIISPGMTIVGGGVLIIGQEQDSIDGSFESIQSWVGDVADLHIWDEVLDQNQISEAGKCKGKRKSGNVFSWMRTPIATLDGVIISETELCEI